jgi:hypothetical protein
LRLLCHTYCLLLLLRHLLLLLLLQLLLHFSDASSYIRSARGGDQPLLRHCDVSLSNNGRKPQCSRKSNARPQRFAWHDPRPHLSNW